jgi:hypothetical protein
MVCVLYVVCVPQMASSRGAEASEVHEYPPYIDDQWSSACAGELALVADYSVYANDVGVDDETLGGVLSPRFFDRRQQGYPLYGPKCHAPELPAAAVGAAVAVPPNLQQLDHGHQYQHNQQQTTYQNRGQCLLPLEPIPASHTAVAAPLGMPYYSGNPKGHTGIQVLPKRNAVCVSSLVPCQNPGAEIRTKRPRGVTGADAAPSLMSHSTTAYSPKDESAHSSHCVRVDPVCTILVWIDARLTLYMR